VNSPDVQAGRPRDRGRWAWWSLAPFGWATWFGFLIAGARTDSRRLKAYAALWAALATVPFIIDAFAADGDPGDTIVGLSVFVVWFAGIAHAFAVRQRMTTAPDELRIAVLFGITLGAMNVAIYSAFDRIPLGIAVTIEFAGPLAVAVAGSRRALDGLWVVLAATGILLLADGGGSGGLDGWGIAFALVAATAWAAYIVLSQRTGRVWPGGSGLAVAMVVGAVLAAPLGIAQAGGALLHPDLLAAGAAVALASSVIPYSLELEALRRLPARVFGILMSLEPAVAALAGLVVLGQSLALRDWLAIALVIAASAGATATAAPAPN
jgi:inner membrane transporter RhtA